jgi:hypothetical protein
MGEMVRSDDFASTLADHERRLKVQESTSRLISSSIRDGSLTLQDANGVGIVVLGKQPNGTHGISVLDANGQTLFRITSEEGQVAPRGTVPISWSLGSFLAGSTTQSFRPGTSNAAFTELWRGDFWSVGSKVDYDLTAYANGGNMTWQIKCYEVSGGTPTVVVGPTTETTNAQRSGTFTIPAACLASGTDPAGRFMTVRVEAKLNSGAITADMTPNTPFTSHN